MKDLDFDELDRAVNSLMSNVSDLDTPKPEEAEKEKTLEITPSQGGDSPATPPSAPVAPAAPVKPAEKKPAPATTPAAKPAPPRSPLAARRPGRFMDVVHPSSSMKSSAPARPAVSRQGVTISPSPAASKPLEKPTEPLRPEPQATKPEPMTDEAKPDVASRPPEEPEAHSHHAPVSDWPDPLEMADFKDEPTKEETPKTLESEAPKEMAQKSQSEEEEKPREEPTPLTSPFLADAKVEKRPLGGGNTDPADTDDELGRAPAFGAKADTDLALADPNAQLPAAPSDVEPELPEELQGDLVAIEADTTTHRKPEEKSEAHTQTEEVEKAPDASPKEKTTPPWVAAAPDEEKPLPAGPTSIAQQYREEPSTGDQDSGAIYDTDTYHQPLAHPAKKKPSWLWIVWIILILALGAAAGAGLYLLGIV